MTVATALVVSDPGGRAPKQKAFPGTGKALAKIPVCRRGGKLQARGLKFSGAMPAAIASCCSLVQGALVGTPTGALFWPTRLFSTR